ncbi:DUF4240 domain-containing protein [Amycolatopsis cihanbeyliensis]|uniref:Uncharacterized protein DUF4240 n=1 Tax=Amycolatopsis cihanbeyliensis TaxID=1128664 RepID=A0A542DEH0_AMYCI|nr:DUF4240 domain-containing protein [Amycolatopsis cihanbeyliensis]TQJ01478.1 uncharacterized protein DUF4240 [Amycolatopsis cihanbeyliensis]
MREHHVWRLIRQARRDTRDHLAGTRDRHSCLPTVSGWTALSFLGKSLQDRPLADVVAFQHLLIRIHRRAYRWDLWLAFGIALGGADEDRFDDCICWLVLRGRRAFARVLIDPDTLAGMDLGPMEVSGSGGLATLTHEVLVPGGGEALSRWQDEWLHDVVGSIPPAGPPLGDPPPQDLAAARRRFPKLAARHLPPEQADPIGPLIRHDFPVGRAR